MFVKNYDGKVYQDKEELEHEKLDLSASQKNIKKLDDGTYHVADLMAHKL